MEHLPTNDLLCLPDNLDLSIIDKPVFLQLSNPYPVNLYFKIKSTDCQTLMLSQFEGIVSPLSKLSIRVHLTIPRQERSQGLKLQVKWCFDFSQLAHQRLEFFPKECIQSKIIKIMDGQTQQTGEFESRCFETTGKNIECDVTCDTLTHQHRIVPQHSKEPRSQTQKKKPVKSMKVTPSSPKKSNTWIINLATTGVLATAYLIFSQIAVI